MTDKKTASRASGPPSRQNQSMVAQVARAATRPIVTIIFTCVIAQVVIEGIEPPQWFLTLAIPCIAWWFGERAVRHYRGREK